MPLVTVREIYDQAAKGGYAVGGFDAEHLYMVKAIVEAAEETRSPVIIFLWEKDIEMAGHGNLENIVGVLGDKASVPVAMMLDHGTTLEFCSQCISSGHSGVMIDASHHPLQENIAKTKKVVELARAAGTFVEGEIGTIARTFEDTGKFSEPPKFTDPDEAVRFALESGVDAMAISIGSASGLYNEAPQLDFELLRKIRCRTAVKLILHGGSGIPPDQIRQAVAGGIVGIRFATENRLAFFDAMEAKRKELGLHYPDSRVILRAGADSAKEKICDRMLQMGCAGKAAHS
jgi:fructose-bisphosphate aldolase class II